MLFKLSSNQSDRINFDQLVHNYALDCISSMPEDYLSETPAAEIAEDYYGDGYDTDDDAEAKSRHMNVFAAAVNEAKAEL